MNNVVLVVISVVACLWPVQFIVRYMVNGTVNRTLAYCDVIHVMSTWTTLGTVALLVLFAIIVSSIVFLTLGWTVKKSRTLLSSFGINQERLSLVSRLQLRHSIFVSKVHMERICTGVADFG